MWKVMCYGSDKDQVLNSLIRLRTQRGCVILETLLYLTIGQKMQSH